MNPVPHVSARAIRDVKELDYFIKNLSETCNVTEVLVIAGSGKKPVGDFHETMQILETGVLQNYNIKIIGVAGHPEGSPDIENDLILDSLKRKYECSKKNKKGCRKESKSTIKSYSRKITSSSCKIVIK